MRDRKVIIIGPAFPFRGGIANFNNALAEAFDKKGVDVGVVSFSLQYPSLLFPGKTQYEEGNPPKNIKIDNFINSINPFSWFITAAKINKQNPDYVIIRYWLPFMAPCLGTIARLLKKNIKILAITDNIIPHEKRIGDQLLTHYFVKGCKYFVALSSSVLNELSAFTNTTHKIFIPHPIYNVFGNKISKKEALLELGLNPKDRHLLFFGFIRKYKGLDLILKALSDTRIKDLNVKLIIAGEFYEDKKIYLDLIDSLSINNQVILHSGFIPASNVRHYFCASDMITQTYHTATQSGVTQIAYHFERPMLVTDVGGLSEIVRHKKVGYVTQKDPVDIADYIFDFYSNNKEEEFSQNTIEEKKRFSWEGFIDGVEELLDI